jgi:hypothetical protein
MAEAQTADDALPPMLASKQLESWFRNLHRRPLGGRHRRHGRVFAALVRELSEPDESAVQATLDGTSWFQWLQRARARDGLASAVALGEKPQVSTLPEKLRFLSAESAWKELESVFEKYWIGINTIARSIWAKRKGRALAATPPRPPQPIDVQKTIERCQCTRASFVGAARLLQALPRVMGTVPSIGCLVELMRLCVEMHAALYLRFSDQIMQMMRLAMTEAMQAKALADLEQIIREVRYLSFRYIVELGLPKHPERVRGINDERLLHWFNWSMQEILVGLRPMMERLYLMESNQVRSKGVCLTQAPSLSETQVSGASRVISSNTRPNDGGADRTAPASTAPGTAPAIVPKDSPVGNEHLFQVPVLVLNSALAAAVRLGRPAEATEILVHFRPSQTPEPLKLLRRPCAKLIRPLLQGCAASGLISEALEVVAQARLLGYRLRSSDIAHVFDAAAEAARRQQQVSASPPNSRIVTKDPGCFLDRIFLPAVDIDMIFHIYHRLDQATACRFENDVYIAMARAITVAPPAEQRAERAMSVLKETRRRRMRSSSLLLQQLILACVSAGDVRRALAIHIHMAERNMPLAVSVANILVELCLEKGHTGTARAILEDVAIRGNAQQINAETLSLLVKYWSQVGNEQQALVTMDRFRSMEAGMKPTETAYVAMLELAAGRGDVNAALRWMQTLEDHLAGQLPAVKETEISETRVSMPSERAFRALFQCLRKAAAADMAMSLLREYAARYGYQPSPAVYEIVYETCLRGSRVDYMRQLREEIQQRRVMLPQMQALSASPSR